MRYAFQHVLLPAAVFANDPFLMRDLITPSTTPFMLIQARALSRCALAGVLKYDETNGEEVLRLMEVFEPMEINAHYRGGYTAYLITMPPPQKSPEAHFAAILLKDYEDHLPHELSPSTKYFLLEKGLLSDQPFFCEWTANRSHRNFAQLPADPYVFLDAIFERVLGKK